MPTQLSDLNPKLIWKYFDEITQVPRPSKHEEKIIAYIEQFAKTNKLDFSKDEIGNIVIRKKATPGFEHAPCIALQSHMDMVCEKHSHIEKDFMNDPIDTFIEGDWVKAKGTTLGADNGIGVALQLALLSDTTLEHGDIECLFTVDEETGLSGAFGLQAGFLKSKVLLNLDSEDDGQFFIGCAGGKDTLGKLKISSQNAPNGYSFYKICISGLKGGHSGDDIHRKLGNANQLLSRFIWMNQKVLDLTLAEIDGGNLRNAIPREAYAVLALPQAQSDILKAKTEEFNSILKKELFISDPDVVCTIEKTNPTEKVFTEDFQNKLLNLIYAMPHGVIAWSQDIDDFVETSTNLASVKISGDDVIVTTSQRSSVKSAIENICSKVASVFELAGAEYEHTDGYPGWTPNPNSKILKIAVAAWKKMYGTEPVQRAIHAGLECGLFSEKYPDMDMISYGPTMRGVHSPDEMLFIPAVEKFWNFTCQILKDVKNY